MKVLKALKCRLLHRKFHDSMQFRQDLGVFLLHWRSCRCCKCHRTWIKELKAHRS